MLIHKKEIEETLPRVVVLGSKGFVGSHIVSQLQQEHVKVLGISKNEINLLNNEAEEKLLNTLKPNDALVIVSSMAPCKNAELLINNIFMMKIICNVIQKTSLSHVIYISSDAVYSDDVTLVSEHSQTMPSSFHGMMHMCRELMLKQAVNKIPLAILRPSVLYGVSDPHNSYGPNRFLRQIKNNQDIPLFGEGEEKRDHVFIEDVAKIVSLVIHYKSAGILNIATGDSYSFKEVAEEILRETQSSNRIHFSPRNNPIMHRYFDISASYKSFPNFKYMSFVKGLKKIVQLHQIEA